MRLIDADEYLKKVCTYKKTGCGSCKLQTACPADEPVVKAIPVEWMEKWMLDNWELECNYGIEQMIEDWEAENEKQTVE